MKLAYVILSGLCCSIFAYEWYTNALIPAWSALPWCLIVFFQDIDNYLDSKWEQKKL